MAEADVLVNQCVENVNEKNINKILEDKVMISIRELHRRKGRADTDSIITETVDMNPEKVKSLLNKLCEDRILKITNRSGLESYRFIDNEDYKQNTVTTVAEKTPEPDFLEKVGIFLKIIFSNTKSSVQKVLILFMNLQKLYKT